MTARDQYLAMMARIRGNPAKPEVFDRLPSGLTDRVGFRGMPAQWGPIPAATPDLSVRPNPSMSAEQLSSMRFLYRPEEKICASTEFMKVRCLILKEWRMFNLLLDLCKLDNELFTRMQSIRPTLLSMATQIATEGYESSNKMESTELARATSLETLTDNYKKIKGAVIGISQLIKRARYG